MLDLSLSFLSDPPSTSAMLLLPRLRAPELDQWASTLPALPIAPPCSVIALLCSPESIMSPWKVDSGDRATGDASGRFRALESKFSVPSPQQQILVSTNCEV